LKFFIINIFRNSEVKFSLKNTVSETNQSKVDKINENKKPINITNSNENNLTNMEKKVSSIESNQTSEKNISIFNLKKKNCPDLEKYIQKLNNININDQETQNNLKNTFSIINTNKEISNIFNKSKELFQKTNETNNVENLKIGKIEFHKLLNYNLIDKTTEISDISQIFSSQSIKRLFETQYFEKIDKLNKTINSKISNLENIVSHYHKLENNCNEILNNVTTKENEVESMLNFNGEFFNNNKNFLIRNEILQTFLDKIIMTKEEKDNLLKKNLFDEKFFGLIKKLFEIKYYIKILERNSEKFSKNLIFSIKENFNIMDDLMNEKIVLYIKEILRNSEKFFSNKNIFNNQKNYYNNLYQEFSKEFNIDNWIIAISYVSEKDNYKNFIIKEYVNSRKRIIENILKQKYMKINKIEFVFENLICDTKIFYLKEFLLFQVFFGNNILIEINLNQTGNTKKEEKSEDNISIENIENTELKMSSSDNNKKNLFFEENLLNLNTKEKLMLYKYFFNNFNFSNEIKDQIKDNENPSLKSINNRIYNFSNIILNETNDFVKNLVEDLNYLRNILKAKFIDTNFSINQLNQILYILEEIYYDNVRYLISTKNLEKDMNENFKMLLLSYKFEYFIEEFFTGNEDLNHFELKSKIKNNSINIINLNKSYKKQFANNSVRLFNENYKFLQKIYRASYDLLFETENNVNDSNSENSLIKTYYSYMDDYFKLFSDYKNHINFFKNFENKINENESLGSNLNPKNQNSFKLLIEFFNQDSFKNQKNKFLILRTLNLLNSFYNKFKVFEFLIKTELDSINSQINYFKLVIVDIYFNEILALTEFDKNLEKIISHEQAINLIQLILEKSKSFIFR